MFIMAFANLVGFSFGLDGLSILLARVFTTEGILLGLKILFSFITGAHLMFAIRRDEKLKYGAQYVKNF